MLKILTLTGLALFTVPALADEGHCKAGEQVVFSCGVGKKTVSVCASDDLTPEQGYVQYRFGPIGAPELIYPENPESFRSKSDAVIFTMRYIKGGWIRFSNGSYSYLAFSERVDTDEGNGETLFNEGVSVLKDGKRVAKLVCKGQAIENFGAVSEFVSGLPEGSEDEVGEVQDLIAD